MSEKLKLFEVLLPVRWKDLDAFNHVNNSKYLSYLEEARLQWMLGMGGISLSDASYPVMVASTLNYREPIVWPNEVRIELYADKVGTSSVTIGHRIVAKEDPERLYCDGSIVAVWVGRDTHKPVALPESVRRACSA